MGKRYEKSRNEVTENKKNFDGLRLDSDDLQKEYTPLTEILEIRELFDDEVSDSIQRVEGVGIAESERISSETDMAEQEKGEIAAEISQEIDKLNFGLDKLRRMENFEFGGKATEKGVSEYKRQIGKFKELMSELGGPAETADISDSHGIISTDMSDKSTNIPDTIRDLTAESQNRNNYSQTLNRKLTIIISRLFNSGISDSLPDNRGIDLMETGPNNIIKVSVNSYSRPSDNPVLAHRMFGGVYEDATSGIQVNAFGTNDPRISNLEYSQGNNSSGYRNTCGIAQQAGVMILAGYNETEDSMVKHNKSIRACSREYIFTPSENGGTTPRSIAAALSSKGLSSHYEYNVSEENIAALVENGRGVIAGVNAGSLWNSSFNSSAYGDGGANHAIQIIGTGRDRNTNEIQGFFINDTGRDLASDQKRWISIDDFREAYNVRRSAIIATDQAIR